MARHNIYIREDNEEAWKNSSKSEFINEYLERSTQSSRTKTSYSNNDLAAAQGLGQLKGAPTVYKGNQGVDD